MGMGRGPHIPGTEISTLAKKKQNKEGISVFLPLPAPHSGHPFTKSLALDGRVGAPSTVQTSQLVMYRPHEQIHGKK